MSQDPTPPVITIQGLPPGVDPVELMRCLQAHAPGWVTPQHVMVVRP